MKFEIQVFNNSLPYGAKQIIGLDENKDHKPFDVGLPFLGGSSGTKYPKSSPNLGVVWRWR